MAVRPRRFPAPQNSIIGGATLWVLMGHEDEEYKGVADFFNYLSSPEVQAEWHQFSGYLPITQAAYELGQSQGFYEKNPGTDVAIPFRRPAPARGHGPGTGARSGGLSAGRAAVEPRRQAQGADAARDQAAPAATAG